METNYKNLSILIPTINERDNLKKMLPELRNRYPGASLYILDDGSTDGTYGYMEKITTGKVTGPSFKNPVYFLSRDKNIILTNDTDFDRENFNRDRLNLRNTAGLTASVLDGLAMVETENFTVIDADFQHPLELIDKMSSKLKNNELITAYRAKLKGFPFYRKLITKLGTFIAKSALPPHSRVKDPLSGAFAGKTAYIRRHIFNTPAFKGEGFKVLFDLLKILPNSVRIGETGYEFKMRSRGESKIGFKQMCVFFKSVFTPKTTKLYSGLLLFLITLAVGLTLIFIYGDIAISDYLRAVTAQNPGLKSFFRIVTDYGNPLYYAIFIFILLYGIIKKRKRILKLALIYILVQVIASGIITGGLKIAVGRPRPKPAAKYKSFKHDFFTESSEYKSFPSGHTTDAFSSAGVLWGFLSSYLFSFLAFGFSMLIGISRIFVGSHYPLDVLAGMAVGFLTGLIITIKKF